MIKLCSTQNKLLMCISVYIVVYLVTQFTWVFQAQHYYLIQDLITWKDYVLQVAAYNNKGVGVYSDSIRIKTKEGGQFFFIWLYMTITEFTIFIYIIDIFNFYNK